MKNETHFNAFTINSFIFYQRAAAADRRFYYSAKCSSLSFGFTI